jgi:hypothetical protein
VTDKGYWNFSFNSFLQFKLEADVSPDINLFIQNNAESLKELHDSKISITEQVKYYGSMSAVGMNVKISTDEILTLIFSRIWYSKRICHGACNPDRSYIYIEAFTSNYRKTTYNLNSKNGKLLKVPSILNITTPELGECCLGPEDPRIVLDENNQLFLTFNMIDIDKKRKIWLYNLLTSYQAPFSIQNHSLVPVEKNWSPFIKDNKLYFIYSYNPFKILQCLTKQGSCEFISDTQSHQ